MIRAHLLRALAVACVAIGSPVHAQDWPSRPVTLVNAFASGSNADILYRAIAKHLSERFGQPFNVESRPGAGGSLAAAQVAKAPADGSVLLFLPAGPAVTNTLLQKVTYDSAKDFEPVIMIGETPVVIVSNPQLKFKTLGDLVAYGKSHPNALNIGHSGAGSLGHLAAALFMARTGLKAALIGYRGPGPVVTDVLGGQIQAGFPLYVPTVKSVSVLAVTSEQRAGFLPEVPTARESGIDVVASIWTALVGPAGMPKDIAKKLNTAINDYLNSSEGRQQLVSLGFQLLGGAPERVTQIIVEDKAKWARVIADAGIRLDAN